MMFEGSRPVRIPDPGMSRRGARRNPCGAWGGDRAARLLWGSRHGRYEILERVGILPALGRHGCRLSAATALLSLAHTPCPTTRHHR